jgi:hypothetical protein
MIVIFEKEYLRDLYEKGKAIATVCNIIELSNHYK